ncbi:hypothetical protein CDAR_404951 [Caerostris darwini]|uniref:Uncharacterized protein n=1 Tax=Caerostris darwini TaxID=1538125 RepID=A0AAV4U6K8_9ARAC|nr:hypothetical protein CDAR_404951 [Caerostris darwini]
MSVTWSKTSLTMTGLRRSTPKWIKGKNRRHLSTRPVNRARYPRPPGTKKATVAPTQHAEPTRVEINFEMIPGQGMGNGKIPDCHYTNFSYRKAPCPPPCQVRSKRERERLARSFFKLMTLKWRVSGAKWAYLKESPRFDSLYLV